MDDVMDQQPTGNANATQCLVISNVFDIEHESGPEWDREVRDDLVEELRSHGGAVHVYIDRLAPSGNVYVKSPSMFAAQTAFTALHGCWFAGRQLSARYVSPENYHELFPESANACQILTPQVKERRLASELAKLKEKNKKENEALKTTKDLAERLRTEKKEFETEIRRLKVQLDASTALKEAEIARMKQDHRKTKDDFEKARQLAIRFRNEKQELERANGVLRRENDDFKRQLEEVKAREDAMQPPMGSPLPTDFDY
ncbi:RNA-binding protein 39 [Aphelenchoides avenae]|nr:RNA-binding protein 39 [Aphelenchus avenae]KAH7720676.1 RNA-binding protein 39 [Aphelenchus avenae]